MYSRELIGLALRLLRMKKNLNQETASRKVNITQGTLSKVEVGQLDLNTSTFLHLLTVYKTTPNKFIKLLNQIQEKCDMKLTDEFIKATLENQRLEIKDKKRKKMSKYAT